MQQQMHKWKQLCEKETHQCKNPFTNLLDVVGTGDRDLMQKSNIWEGVEAAHILGVLDSN